ncbi:plasmid pRiA4b ORF-3 family protein [Tautonia sp. JC769]|uniref:plasmid pRiA4b ORF-3 family protein n=1 Tax=Tautonia sp. JC769 TaxID=3232135 RepID=UPI003459D04A
MPKRSSKQDETFPLKLTARQRESLLHCTRLKRGLKRKVEDAGEGTQAVDFTRKQLEEMAEEVDTSLAFAPSPDRKRLSAVLEKVDDLLDAFEGEEPGGAGLKPGEGTGTVYQLKVTLRGSRPPIWRRIRVPDCTLGELHEVIQVVMGWEDAHLHEFVVRGERYGPPPPDDFGMDFGSEEQDEDTVLLSRVAEGGKRTRMRYVYDFGDSWEHEVTVEKALAPEPGVEYPRCVGGARACPPEDCGGVWGYADFLDAIADPGHEMHEEMREWVGGEFDPEAFDIEAVNEELQQTFRGEP